MEKIPYRGRIAPTPTGYLHLGHARTFWKAQERAREQNGLLILRNEDLDSVRCKPEFVSAMLEDLHWFGFEWQEGTDCGGPFAPYHQSERYSFYRTAFGKLKDAGHIYPCTCSRKDIQQSARAPHAGDDELIYPGTCRGNCELQISSDESLLNLNTHSSIKTRPSQLNWRFRVPDGETISFVDGYFGKQRFIAGKDFGDFIIWRHDDVPSYQLAVTVDDAAMRVTEAVRGADLLVSTARQILLYRALGLEIPQFYHCPLLTDEAGVRLAKRNNALSLRALREQGVTPEALRENWDQNLR